MFKFLRRLGCLAILLVLGVVAWMTRDLWRERLLGQRVPGREVEWQTASPVRVATARTRLTDLGKSTGPVYANFSGGEIASLIMGEASQRYPEVLSDVRGAVVGDKLQLEARVDLSEARGLDRLGPMAGLLRSRRRVTIAGEPGLREPGLGEFRVESVRIDDIQVPQPLISAFLDQMLKEPVADTRANASPTITFLLPRHVGDIRVSKGVVTLYKRVP